MYIIYIIYIYIWCFIISICEIFKTKEKFKSTKNRMYWNMTKAWREAIDEVRVERMARPRYSNDLEATVKNVF